MKKTYQVRHDPGRPWQPWERNEEVQPLVKAPRDTVLGDVIVDLQAHPYSDGSSTVAEVIRDRKGRLPMPTKEQMDAAVEHINDVIGRNYIEGDGDMCSCWFQPEGGGPVGMTSSRASRQARLSLSTTSRRKQRSNCSISTLIGRALIVCKNETSSGASLTAKARSSGWTISSRMTSRRNQRPGLTWPPNSGPTIKPPASATTARRMRRRMRAASRRRGDD